VALLNEILVGRYNRFCQKLLSMKGPASLVQLRGEMGVEIPLFHGTENRYLEAWDLFGIAIGVVAQGVGNVGALRIRNPSGSNVVAVVTRALMQPQVVAADASSCYTGVIAVDLAGIVAVTGAFDGRGRKAPTCIVSRGTAVFPSSQITAQQQEASETAECLRSGDEIPVLPGSFFEVEGNATNTANTMTIWWRERFLEDSERA
jgi:hypothetical protein